MRSIVPGRGTVPCRGGCGTKVVNHIQGSDIAKLCYKMSPGRSGSLKVKNFVRNQDIKVRTRANDSIAFHNSMTELTEKIMNVILKKSKIHSLKIRGYDAQTEEFLDSWTADPMFKKSHDELSKASFDYESDPSVENSLKFEIAYNNFYEMAELRKGRLIEAGRMSPDYNWEWAIELHTAGLRASAKNEGLSDRERQRLIAEMLEKEQSQAPSDTVDEEVERLLNSTDPNTPHFEWDDETTHLGLGLIDQENKEREAESRKNKPKLVVPNDAGEWDEV